MALLPLLRRNPQFARLWVAEAISLAGDWFSLVAVSVLAVQTGGGQGAWAVATTLAVYEIPMALMRPVAGVLADRFDRRTMLLTTHLVQAALTAVMAHRAAAGDLVGLQALVFLRSLLAGLDWPARAGAIQRLVAPEDAMAAHALGGAMWSAMYAVGMALGGLIASAGIPQALVVDAVSFLVAAALVATLPPIPTRGVEGIRLVDGLRQAWFDLREAVRLARGSRPLLRAVTSKSPLGLVDGAGVVVLNLAADAQPFMGAGAATLGILQATRGIGTGVGPVLAARLVDARWDALRVWWLMAWTGIAGVALLGAAAAPWAVVATVALWGVGTGANWMIAGAELQRRSPDEAIGRLSGLDFLSVELCFGLSALAAGAAIEAAGDRAAGVVVGVALGAVSWLAVQLATRE